MHVVPGLPAQVLQWGVVAACHRHSISHLALFNPLPLTAHLPTCIHLPRRPSPAKVSLPRLDLSRVAPTMGEEGPHAAAAAAGGGGGGGAPDHPPAPGPAPAAGADTADSSLAAAVAAWCAPSPPLPEAESSGEALPSLVPAAAAAEAAAARGGGGSSALPPLLPAAEDSQQLVGDGEGGVAAASDHYQQQQQQGGEVGVDLEQQQAAAAAAAAADVLEDPAAAFAADLPGSQAEEAFYVYPAEVPDEVRLDWRAGLGWRVEGRWLGCSDRKEEGGEKYGAPVAAWHTTPYSLNWLYQQSGALPPPTYSLCSACRHVSTISPPSSHTCAHPRSAPHSSACVSCCPACANSNSNSNNSSSAAGGAPCAPPPPTPPWRAAPAQARAATGV
jgi:hypothetical protein